MNTSFLRQRSFWVAIVLLSYQLGMAIFFGIIATDNAPFMQFGWNNKAWIVPMVIMGCIALGSFGVYAWILKQKRYQLHKWVIVSIASIIATLAETAVWGLKSFIILPSSFLGILIAIGVLPHAIMSALHATMDLKEQAVKAAIVITPLTWLVLFFSAPILPKKFLQILATIFFVMLASSIAGCVGAPEYLKSVHI